MPEYVTNACKAKAIRWAMENCANDSMAKMARKVEREFESEIGRLPVRTWFRWYKVRAAEILALAEAEEKSSCTTKSKNARYSLEMRQFTDQLFERVMERYPDGKFKHQDISMLAVELKSEFTDLNLPNSNCNFSAKFVRTFLTTYSFTYQQRSHCYKTASFKPSRKTKPKKKRTTKPTGKFLDMKIFQKLLYQKLIGQYPDRKFTKTQVMNEAIQLKEKFRGLKFEETTKLNLYWAAKFMYAFRFTNKRTVKSWTREPAVDLNENFEAQLLGMTSTSEQSSEGSSGLEMNFGASSTADLSAECPVESNEFDDLPELEESSDSEGHTEAEVSEIRNSHEVLSNIKTEKNSDAEAMDNDSDFVLELTEFSTKTEKAVFSDDSLPDLSRENAFSYFFAACLEPPKKRLRVAEPYQDSEVEVLHSFSDDENDSRNEVLRETAKETADEILDQTIEKVLRKILEAEQTQALHDRAIRTTTDEVLARTIDEITREVVEEYEAEVINDRVLQEIAEEILIETSEETLREISKQNIAEALHDRAIRTVFDETLEMAIQEVLKEVLQKRAVRATTEEILLLGINDVLKEILEKIQIQALQDRAIRTTSEEVYELTINEISKNIVEEYEAEVLKDRAIRRIAEEAWIEASDEILKEVSEEIVVENLQNHAVMEIDPDVFDSLSDEEDNQKVIDTEQQMCRIRDEILTTGVGEILQEIFKEILAETVQQYADVLQESFQASEILEGSFEPESMEQSFDPEVLLNFSDEMAEMSADRESSENEADVVDNSQASEAVEDSDSDSMEQSFEVDFSDDDMKDDSLLRMVCENEIAKEALQSRHETQYETTVSQSCSEPDERYETESEAFDSDDSDDEMEVSQDEVSTEYPETENDENCETRMLQSYSEPTDGRYEADTDDVLPGWQRKSRKIHKHSTSFEAANESFEKYCEKARVIDYLLSCSGEEKRRVALTLMSSQVNVQIECPVCYSSLNPENPASIFNHYKNCAA